MPGLLMHQLAKVSCPHGTGTVNIPPAPGPPVRAAVGVSPVAPSTTILTVIGCPFTVPTPGGPKPQPCVTVEWANVSARVRVNGTAILLQSTPPSSPAAAMCFSAEKIPQGPPIVQFVQTRVIAT